MSITAAIDMSTFIWSEEDYCINKSYYYQLMDIVPTVFEQIQKLRLPLLLRNELYQIIANDFPYLYLNQIGYSYYSTKILRFLTSSEWRAYEETEESTFSTIPEITKSYFNQELQKECNHQIIHLYNNALEHKFIAYRHFYNAEANLSIKNNQNTQLEVETLCYQSEKEIIDFFEKFLIKFEHNTKHRREGYRDYERDEDVSPFSCYFNQGEEKAQELLDNAIPYKGHFYNFDLENNVFVRFIKTNGLIYHGHDLLDEENNIPNEVKKKFFK